MSVSSVVLDPVEVLSRPPAATAVRRRFAVVLGVAAPVLLLIGTALTPRLSGSNAAVLAHLPQVADQLLAAHLLNTAASFAYLATVLVTWRIPDRAGSVLRLIGGAIVIVGFLSDAAGEVLDGYAAWAGAKAGVPAAVQARMFDYLDAAPAALPVSWLAIPVAMVGGLLLWIGVLRAHRSVPMWAPIVAILGTLVTAVLPTGPLALLGIVGTAGSVAVTLYAARAGEH